MQSRFHLINTIEETALIKKKQILLIQLFCDALARYSFVSTSRHLTQTQISCDK